ncbi:hypothetical protein FX016_23250 [Cupriavidus gilardii]|nr:hypothetical protein FX016_23250 [Cupriavidus gilardii]
MRSRGNEHRWATAPADKSEPPAPRRPSFPAPLTRAELKAMYQRNRSPEVRALLWEVARLQAVARRAAQLSACFPMYDSEANTSAFQIILNALRRELANETCIAEAAELTREWDEVFSVDLNSGRRR